MSEGSGGEGEKRGVLDEGSERRTKGGNGEMKGGAEGGSDLGSLLEGVEVSLKA